MLLSVADVLFLGKKEEYPKATPQRIRILKDVFMHIKGNLVRTDASVPAYLIGLSDTVLIVHVLQSPTPALGLDHKFITNGKLGKK